MWRTEYIGPVFRRLIQGLTQRLPSRCAVCHAWPSRPVCEACVNAFAQPCHRCQTCARALLAATRQCGACILTPPPLDACLTAVAYAYPWSDLVGDFKFREQPGWAATFAQLLRAAPWVEPALESCDMLMPMPMSKERLRERGYNQSHVLATALDRQKVAQDILLRVTDTPPQRTLPRSERLRSVQHAFAVDPFKVEYVRGKRIVVLDDVMTSGASLHAAASALRASGAAHITGMVFARTE